MVISAPVFAADGKLLDAPGLHRDERLWLHKDPRLNLAEVPKEPTRDGNDQGSLDDGAAGMEMTRDGNDQGSLDEIGMEMTRWK